MTISMKRRVELGRRLQYLDKVLFLDGMSGCGKGLLTRFISLFNHVENPVWNIKQWRDLRDRASAKFSWGELRAIFSR